MPPVDGQRVRFPGYSLELTGGGEVLVYRTALRHLAAALIWRDGDAVLDAGSLTVAGGLLRHAVRPHERAFVVRRMVEFLGDGGRTRVSVEPPFAIDAPSGASGADTIGTGGEVMTSPIGAGRRPTAGRVARAGCVGALLGALLGGFGFAQIALSAGGQVPAPMPGDFHNPGQVLLYAFIFSFGAVPGAIAGTLAGVFLGWTSPPSRDRPGPPTA